MQGTIVSVRISNGYGFIQPDGGGENIFFHASDLVGLDFDETLRERAVVFATIHTDRGLKAINVRAAR